MADAAAHPNVPFARVLLAEYRCGPRGHLLYGELEINTFFLWTLREAAAEVRGATLTVALPDTQDPDDPRTNYAWCRLLIRPEGPCPACEAKAL